MGNNFSSDQLAIIIGPSVGGGLILIAVIISAIVVCHKERNRRREESTSSSASLVKGGYCLPNFRFPTFNYIPKKLQIDTGSTPQSSSPCIAGNRKVYTVPITPSDSSKPSTVDSQSPYVNITTQTMTEANNDTVTEKYYYNFDNIATKPSSPITTTTNFPDKPSPPATITTTTTNFPDKPSPPATVTTTTANFLAKPPSPPIALTTATTPETTATNAVLRRSREVSRVTSPNERRIDAPVRSTIMTEDAWNSTLDQIFNSALSIHEPITRGQGNVRTTVFPS